MPRIPSSLPSIGTSSRSLPRLTTTSNRAYTTSKLQDAYATSKQREESALQAEGIAKTAKQSSPPETPEAKNNANPAALAAKKKTLAEIDEELRRRMSGLRGDGGDAGVQFEDGQPIDLKRSVKNNMFRYI